MNSVFSEESSQKNNIKWEKIRDLDIKSNKSVQWERLDNNKFIRRHTNKTTPNDKIYKRSKKIFRSSSRNIIFKNVLYPEMSFWIPSSFKQSRDYKFTLKGQLLGNPTNRITKDFCNWDDFWKECSDAQFLMEYTPIINNYFSLGLNYSQQESFIGNRSDGGWQDAGQALGFQLKANFKENQAISFNGNNLYNPYGKGGPNAKHPKAGEKIQADLGRSYLFLYSKAWDLGKILNYKSNSILSLNAGFGNGRYKTGKELEKDWINLGKYNTIYSLGLSLNKKFSVFIEDAGQYSGVGLSVNPINNLPITGTIMLRDFKGSKSGIVNCENGDKDNCRMTVDTRLVLHF